MRPTQSSGQSGGDPARHAIRKLWPHERRLDIADLTRLDRRSGINRFGMRMTDEALARYASHSFWVGGIVHTLSRADWSAQRANCRACSHSRAYRPKRPSASRKAGAGAALADSCLLSAVNRALPALDIMGHPGNHAILARALTSGRPPPCWMRPWAAHPPPCRRCAICSAASRTLEPPDRLDPFAPALRKPKVGG